MMAKYSIRAALEIGTENDYDFDDLSEEFDNVDDINASYQAYKILRDTVMRRPRCRPASVLLCREREGEQPRISVDATWGVVCRTLRELKDARQEISRLKRRLRRIRSF